MNAEIVPFEDSILIECDFWVKTRSDSINHLAMNNVLNFFEKYLADHSDRENIELFLLRYKEEHRLSFPEFSILFAHSHFEHPKNADDVQILATVLRLIENEVCEHLCGRAEVKYINTHREKMIIEITGITDYDLIQEIVEKGGGWRSENYGNKQKQTVEM